MICASIFSLIVNEELIGLDKALVISFFKYSDVSVFNCLIFNHLRAI